MEIADNPMGAVGEKLHHQVEQLHGFRRIALIHDGGSRLGEVLSVSPAMIPCSGRFTRDRPGRLSLTGDSHRAGTPLGRSCGEAQSRGRKQGFERLSLLPLKNRKPA
jgi:hypothetical protein